MNVTRMYGVCQPTCGDTDSKSLEAIDLDFRHQAQGVCALQLKS